MNHKSLTIIAVILLSLVFASISYAEDPPTPEDYGFRIALLSDAESAAATWTLTFWVEEFGSGKDFKDLSHWLIALPDDAVVVDATEDYEIGKDKKTGLTGIKWDVDDDFTVPLSGFCHHVSGSVWRV